MLGLVIAKVQKILLVDVSLTVLPYDLYVLEV